MMGADPEDTGQLTLSPFSLLSGGVLGPWAAWVAKGAGGSQVWPATTSPDALYKTTRGYALLFK